MPALDGKAGEDIVTSSGDTLLGADDKAGIAEIMTAVAHLAAHPELPRPNLRIAFTPDEEIGMGASLFDVEAFGASCAYTIDGSTLGELQDETFTGAEAIIDIEGVDVHPGFATGKLVNATRLAARIVAELPGDSLSPETTSGREGFIHVYEMSGAAGLGADPRDRPRLRRRPPGRARRAAARDRRAGGGGGADREGDGRGDPAVPQHAQLPRADARDRRRRRARRSAPRASSRSATRSAAAPTARC